MRLLRLFGKSKEEKEIEILHDISADGRKRVAFVEEYYIENGDIMHLDNEYGFSINEIKAAYFLGMIMDQYDSYHNENISVFVLEKFYRIPDERAREIHYILKEHCKVFFKLSQLNLYFKSSL